LSSSQNKQQKVRETVLYLTTEYIKKVSCCEFSLFISFLCSQTSRMNIFSTNTQSGSRL